MRGGPDIKHLDDVSTDEMLRWQFAGGRTPSICAQGSVTNWTSGEPT